MKKSTHLKKKSYLPKIRFHFAQIKDTQLLNDIIQKEFPYVEFGFDRIKEKILSKNFFIIKVVKEKKFVGFGEIEFIENCGRINCIFVEKKERRKGIAISLIKRLLKECKKKKIVKVFLLVKEKNFVAKKLYSKAGFEFERMHDKIIQKNKVEIWILKKSDS